MDDFHKGVRSQASLRIRKPRGATPVSHPSVLHAELTPVHHGPHDASGWIPHTAGLHETARGISSAAAQLGYTALRLVLASWCWTSNIESERSTAGSLGDRT